jgi:hypothetical protein
MLTKASRPSSGVGFQPALRTRQGPVIIGLAQRRDRGAGVKLVAARPAIAVVAAAGERGAVPEPATTAAADGEQLVNGSAAAAGDWNRFPHVLFLLAS